MHLRSDSGIVEAPASRMRSELFAAVAAAAAAAGTLGLQVHSLRSHVAPVHL